MHSESHVCFCSIIPSSILTRLSTSGDAALAEAAARTIRITSSLRAFRAQLSTGAPSPAAVIHTGLRRQVFKCDNGNDLPGDPARMESDPVSSDDVVNQAFDHAGTTWKFFNQIFGRESVDGHGRTLVSSVHYGQNYDNAFWDGQQMVYGDGLIFHNFTGAIEVIAHELTHGVTQFSAQLAYQNQTGALNESMSDVFGSLVKQWSLNQSADQADWLIGAGILGADFNGRALRDMGNPGTAYDDPRVGRDPQPAHMRDYVNTDEDNGGVHANSGIPNLAFVLAAKAIGGHAWEKAGKVWYVTLTERLTAASDFQKCAIETVSVARDLFPNDPSIAQKIAQAWFDVGITVPSFASAPVAVPAAAVAQAATAAVTGMASPIEQQIAALGYAKVIVALKPDAAGLAAGASLISVGMGLQAFFLSPDRQRSLTFAALASNAPPTPMRVYPHLGLAYGLVDAGGVRSLLEDNRVARIAEAAELSLIRPVTVAAVLPKTSSDATWGLKRLNVPTMWAHGYDGTGVIVGHLDTGVDGTHPALAGAISDFAEFDFSGNQVQATVPHDSGEHGTHTAGTIVGRLTERGAFGVAPGARLASALVIEGGQVIPRILAGMEWLVSKKVRILSMSAGLRGTTDAFQEIVNALRNNGVLPIFAVGNEGVDTSRSPGNYANVLSVGACAENGTVADFSSSQKFARAEDPVVPDLVAPGVGVLSSIPAGKFAIMDGTSMATPHVAGLAALLLQAKPTATTDEIEAAILGSCLRPPSMPDNRANRGIPDAVRALQILTGEVLPLVEASALAKPRPALRAAAKKRASLSKGGTRAAAAPKAPVKKRAAQTKRVTKTAPAHKAQAKKRKSPVKSVAKSNPH
jgi:subtilisin